MLRSIRCTLIAACHLMQIDKSGATSGGGPTPKIPLPGDSPSMRAVITAICGLVALASIPSLILGGVVGAYVLGPYPDWLRLVDLGGLQPMLGVTFGVIGVIVGWVERKKIARGESSAAGMRITRIGFWLCVTYFAILAATFFFGLLQYWAMSDYVRDWSE
jgi:hypothetical protein